MLSSSLIELVLLEPTQEDPSFWISLSSHSPWFECRCFPSGSLCSGLKAELSEIVHQGTIVARLGMGSDVSVDVEEDLQVSFTNRVVPKSLRVRQGDSSAATSLVATHSLGKSSSF